MSRSSIRIIIYLVSFSIILTFYYFGRSVWEPYYLKFRGKETVASIIDKYGRGAEQRLKEYFSTANVDYPPESIKLLALKKEKILELWAEDHGVYKWIKDYEIKAASGKRGPKLMQGDGQVPEGIYKIIGLNPNSGYHLSMKLNYPNEFDLLHAEQEGRDEPGNNIFIHGQDMSIGCLAMGDKVIEELFTLVYKVGRENSEVVIAPTDPRKVNLAVGESDPSWVAQLYQQISHEFMKYKRNI